MRQPLLNIVILIIVFINYKRLGIRKNEKAFLNKLINFGILVLVRLSESVRVGATQV
ncbi:hypothetical protein DesyoDRAFT_0550 [Desulfosporosinus youngiae DSM 17734]|uniref:Uncharacterized protein n=1 Tax=Desulfosporosinus youngiae DSM 17734 TaxID=768710 RepID=H5XSR4_9FIRM|nr:hypothetical protein DesyoDRAFT_0550 [Desulfosporosinus youngiae DSM 17734]